MRPGQVGEVARAERLAQRPAFGVVGDGDADPVTARTGIAAVRRHVGILVAVRSERLSGQRLLQNAVADHRCQHLDGGHVDELSLTGEFAMHERRDGREGGRGTDGGVPVAHARAERRPALVSDQRRQACQRGEARRIARLIAHRPVVAPHLDRHRDDVGLDGLHGVVSQPLALHRPRAQVVDHDVAAADQVTQRVVAGRRLDIQVDAQDLGIDAQEERRVVDVGSAVGAHLLGPLRVLHLDHLGAQECQQLPRVRARPDLGELDDPHPFQRPASRRLRRLELRGLGGQPSPRYPVGEHFGRVLSQSRCATADLGRRRTHQVRHARIGRRAEHRMRHVAEETAVAVLRQ